MKYLCLLIYTALFVLSISSCSLPDLTVTDPPDDQCLFGEHVTTDLTVRFYPYVNAPDSLTIILPYATYTTRRQFYDRIAFIRQIEKNITVRITDGGPDTCEIFIPGRPLFETEEDCILGEFIQEGTSHQFVGAYPVSFHYVNVLTGNPGQTVNPDSCWSIAGLHFSIIEVWMGGDTCRFELPDLVDE